jgi:hypothetical protein
VDKSALGWDHKEQLQKHESQKDYKTGSELLLLLRSLADQGLAFILALLDPEPYLNRDPDPELRIWPKLTKKSDFQVPFTMAFVPTSRYRLFYDVPYCLHKVKIQL